MKNDKRITLEVIERWLKDVDYDVRTAAMNACVGKDVPLEIIETGLKDDEWLVRIAAKNACVGKDVPLEIIECWLKDDDDYVRTAAMNACVGKDVPLEIIETGLKDDVGLVRAAAINACKEKGIAIPIIRTFEPPAMVYKKCLGGVIVCATIPADAQVRGAVGQKCRSNKAVITKIIGDLRGEKVGISTWDNVTAYYEGDEIVVEDFDMSNEECSTGFHFFCSREEAESYKS